VLVSGEGVTLDTRRRLGTCPAGGVRRDKATRIDCGVGEAALAYAVALINATNTLACTQIDLRVDNVLTVQTRRREDVRIVVELRAAVPA
jgi:hypothetical protein